MIEFFQQKSNISEVARVFHTSRNKVRKRVKKFSRDRIVGLQNRSRRQKKPPRKTKRQVMIADDQPFILLFSAR